MSRVRIAGAFVAASGAATIFMSVFAFGILFTLAVIPFAVGILQAKTGIRMMVRDARAGSAPYIAAGVGVLVGTMLVPAGPSEMEDARDAWLLVAGLVLIAGNAAAIWVFASQPGGEQ